MRSALLPAALLLGLLLPAAAQIPAHPDELVYPPLDFQPPLAEEYRHDLDGIPVYLAPTDEFPIVSISFTFKGGSYLEPDELTGLGGTLGAMMRRGGTTSVSAQDLDEQLDFLAANAGTSVGDETSGASLNCLKSNFDEAFALFMDMVRNPGFDTERLRVHKSQVIEGFKQRNDNPMGVVSSQMGRLVFGPDHYSGREATQASVEAIDGAALGQLHGRIFHPGNLLVAATGDFDPDELLAALRTAFEGWEAGERAPDPPAPEHVLRPGLYHARTAQADLPQGTTFILSRSITRDDPDAIALQVMNDILGGGGFTSRVTNRVRSDEGLAYTAVTFLQPEVWYPGIFGAFYQSKNPTVALAAKIVLEEIERIRNEPVDDDELRRSIKGFIEEFPQRFASKNRMLSTFVNDELTGRDPTWWQTWREKLAGVSKADVQRVAQKHLHPDGMAIMVVGDWAAIEKGDLEGRASMADFFDGKVQHLPLLDPLTREPVDGAGAARP